MTALIGSGAASDIDDLRRLATTTVDTFTISHNENTTLYQMDSVALDICSEAMAGMVVGNESAD